LHRITTALGAILVAASCGGSPAAPGPPAPPPVTVQVTGISPSAGSTQGGTPITVTGTGFTAGATITIAGVAATNVVVTSASSITAVAPARSAGSGDVVVSSGGSHAVLPNAFRFIEASTSPNAAPVVSAMTVQGSRANQPAGMADLGETVVVTATVTDAETAPASLTYQWSASSGTFSGTGTSVSWKAPDQLPETPASVTLTLTLIEEYIEFNAQNVPVTREHRIVSSREVRVHDSAEEVRAKARKFLLAFSDSSVPTSTVLADFSDSCGGKASEEFDVNRNRCVFTINTSTVGDATPTVAFDGVCPFRGRRADACVVIPVRWESTVRADANSCPLNDTGLAPGTSDVADGQDQVTAVYEQGDWKLCHSDFLPADADPSRFERVWSWP
jgi:hypothetical protein